MDDANAGAGTALDTYKRYMNDGYKKPLGFTSLPLSTSPYLNDPILVEHVARQTLRRNGTDLPPTWNYPVMAAAVEAAQDQERINFLFVEARRSWPELDQWLSERYLSRWKKADLAECAPGTLGHTVFEHFDEYGLENVMSSTAFPCDNDFQYFHRRRTEIHDFMHVLSGAGFDYIGEFLVNMVNYGSFYKYFDPELAKETLVKNSINTFPHLCRASIHYPMGFPYIWDHMTRGVEIGRQSGPWFLKRIEDYIHYPLDEAREALEIRGAVDPDLAETRRQSDHIMEGGQTKMQETALARKKMMGEQIPPVAAE